MFKTVWFVRFVENLQTQEAHRYWLDVHAPMCAATDVGGYIQNHVAGPIPAIAGPAEERTFFDGYATGEWRDREAYEETMARPDWRAVAADAEHFLDIPAVAGLAAQIEEHVLVDGPHSPFKAVWVVRFKEGVDPVEMHRYWLEVHGPLFPLDEMDRYVQNHVVGPLADFGPPVIDGYSECWFTDLDQFTRAIQSDAWAEAVADSPHLFDVSQMWGAVLDERVVKGRPDPGAAR